MIGYIYELPDLPALLSEVIAAVNLDAVQYSDRKDDAAMPVDWLAREDHSIKSGSSGV